MHTIFTFFEWHIITPVRYSSTYSFFSLFYYELLPSPAAPPYGALSDCLCTPRPFDFFLTGPAPSPSLPSASLSSSKPLSSPLLDSSCSMYSTSLLLSFWLLLNTGSFDSNWVNYLIITMAYEFCCVVSLSTTFSGPLFLNLTFCFALKSSRTESGSTRMSYIMMYPLPVPIQRTSWSLW